MQLVNRVAVAIFILDQLSKYLVVHVMRLDQRQEVGVFPPFLNFRMAWNQGINFGLFQSGADVMRWILIGVALVIAAWVWLWVRRERHQPRVLVSAGLLIGGALGNVVDRMIYGAVADFLNMSMPGIDNPYSFNVADVAIFAGALGLVFYTGRPAKAA
jgi:signal peptidase II